MKKILILIFTILVLASCTTLDSVYLESQTALENIEPFEVEPGLEFTGIRLDMIRNMEDPTVFDRKTGLSLKGGFAGVEYSPVGVHLGNGFFLDSNMNLSIDILNYFGIEGNFELKSVKNNFTKETWQISRDGEDYYIEFAGSLVGGKSAVKNGNEYLYAFDGGVVIGNIKQVDGSVYWHNPQALFLDQNYDVIKVDDSSAAILHNDREKARITSPEPGIVLIENVIALTYTVDGIQLHKWTPNPIIEVMGEIQPHSLFVPTKNGFAYLPNKNFAYFVEKEGNVITIYSNSKKNIFQEINITQ